MSFTPSQLGIEISYQCGILSLTMVNSLPKPAFDNFSPSDNPEDSENVADFPRIPKILPFFPAKRY